MIAKEHYNGTAIQPHEIKQMLLEKIDTVSIEQIRDDVIRFIANKRSIEIWSKSYFKDLVDQIKYLERIP